MQHLAHVRHSFAPGPRWIFLPALVALAGCGSDALSLGSNESAVENSECLAAPLEGDLVASSQAEVDALLGCREIPGSLRLITPAGAAGSISLQPLAELRRVGGQLRISGPFTSLAGLESLESVGVLDLRDTELTDLLPLRGLTRVDTPADWRVNGIQIDDCDQLTDLRGLENLTVWGSLLITQSEGLVSLQGLRAPELVESVRLLYLPQLSDVSALAPARSASFFDLTGTAVTSLGGFSLENADTLILMQNPALTDLDGLSPLEEVGHLGIADNDALARIDLPQLRAWDSIIITGNDALLAVPDFASGGSWSGFVSGLTEVPIGFPRRLFEVGDNPLVTSIDMSDPFDVATVVVYRNASLATLTMPGVQRVDSLWIQDNPALSAVSMAQLQQVSTVTVRDNPALSVSSFASVQTFQSELTGNLDTLEP